MRSLTSKDGDLLSHFDKINDGDTNASLENTSLKEMLIDNHSVAVNRGKIEGQLPLENNFDFCMTFQKITKTLGFRLTFKTPDLKFIIFATLTNDIKVTIKVYISL